MNTLKQLFHDEAGFVVSAELVLIATIGVLSMVVGLAEVSNSINQELYDVAQAFDSVNQSYRYSDQGGYEDYGRYNNDDLALSDIASEF